MKYTYYISISKVGNTHHVLHNGTCQIYLSNKEDMIALGRHEQFIVALHLARNNFQKVSPCPKCILKRRLYNLAATKRGPIPIKHLPDA